MIKRLSKLLWLHSIWVVTRAFELLIMSFYEHIYNLRLYTQFTYKGFNFVVNSDRFMYEDLIFDLLSQKFWFQSVLLIKFLDSKQYSVCVRFSFQNSLTPCCTNSLCLFYFLLYMRLFPLFTFRLMHHITHICTNTSVITSEHAAMMHRAKTTEIDKQQ